MREIYKFRAWLFLEKKMSYEDLFGAEKFGGRDCAIMQFTGLKDKNGVECFEGDVVKRSEFNDTCDVVYREDWGAFAFHSKHKKISGDGWSHMHSGHEVYSWEIIGNIYENPELLTPLSLGE